MEISSHQNDEKHGIVQRTVSASSTSLTVHMLFIYASNRCIFCLTDRIGMCFVTRHTVSVRLLQWKFDGVEYNQEQIISARKKSNCLYFQSGTNPGYSRCHPGGYRLCTAELKGRNCQQVCIARDKKLLSWVIGCGSAWQRAQGYTQLQAGRVSTITTARHPFPTQRYLWWRRNTEAATWNIRVKPLRKHLPVNSFRGTTPFPAAWRVLSFPTFHRNTF